MAYNRLANEKISIVSLYLSLLNTCCCCCFYTSVVDVVVFVSSANTVVAWTYYTNGADEAASRMLSQIVGYRTEVPSVE